MTATDPFTNLGFDPSQKFDPGVAAQKLGLMLNHWVSSSTGGDAFTEGVHTPTPTTGVAPTTGATTVPDSGGAMDAIGIPKDTGVAQPFGGSGGHPGIDLSIPVGTPLVAAMDGKITVAGNNDPNGYGNYVEITTANGMTIRYGHLSAISVNVGDTVKAGQLIGKSGGEKGAPGSGNSTGPHLHFEVDVNGQPVDPTAVLAGGGQIIKGTAASNPAVQVAATTTGAASYTSSPANEDPFLAGVHTETAATGTAGTPAAPAGGSTVSGQTTGADSDPNAIDAFLNAIKQHESNGDYKARNGSGLSNAAGAYQFIGTTWRGLGGSTDSAADASPEEQDRIARAYAIQLFNQYHSWRLAAIAWYQPSAADAVARGEDPGAPPGQPRFIDYGNEIERMMSGG